MPVLIPYLVKLFISLGIVFLFYQLVLRRLTFYNANRWYLLFFTAICFFVPLVNVNKVVPTQGEERGLMQFIPSVQSYSIGLDDATQCPIPLWSTSWTKWDWLLFLFVAGAVFLLLRFAMRCISFYKLKRNALLLSGDGMNIYHVDAAIIPFSFGNSIFINSTQHTETELKEIIRHEFIHVKQKHTADILWAEILCMLNWYNPFAWMLKNAMRQNLEFIADHLVLENGVDKKQYQYLLLKVIGNDQFSIAQKFNFSSLKKRIAMMNKTKSARINLLRFLLVLPVIAIILVSFREQFEGKPVITPIQVTDTIPDVKTPNEKGYIINIRDNKGECMVEVKDSKGTLVDKLPLTRWNIQASYYEEMYGDIPPPPPPKPPKAPMPPVLVHVEMPSTTPRAPEVPVQPIQATPEGLQALPAVPPVPATPAQISSKLTTLADDFEITDKKVVLHLRDGTKEEYDLTNPAERKKFESKWGKIYPAKSASPVAIVSHANGQTVIAPLEPLSPVASVGGVLAIDDRGALITGNEDVLVTITKATTRQQLEEYKSQMKAKGITLKYDVIVYDGKGQLVEISGSMKSPDGNSNFSATDFDKLTLAFIKADGQIYFKVNTSTNRESSSSEPRKVRVKA